LNQQIQAIEARSGTCFSISLGEDCRKLLSKDDQKVWLNPMLRWSLSIDEVWILSHGKDTILDVRKERFHFKEKLISHLKNKRIIEIIFDENGTGTKVLFSDDYSLVVLKTGRYSR
jgi:hypothetical protein